MGYLYDLLSSQDHGKDYCNVQAYCSLDLQVQVQRVNGHHIESGAHVSYYTLYLSLLWPLASDLIPLVCCWFTHVIAGGMKVSDFIAFHHTLTIFRYAKGACNRTFLVS